MKALIDSDIICYEFGNMRDLETSETLAWPIVRKFVDERIAKILEETEATDYHLYLTDSKSNFRIPVATILPYKGQRPSDKPPHWENIREHLIEEYDAEVIYGMEADDALGIAQSQDWEEALGLQATDDWDFAAGKMSKYCGTIICSRDKDLSMIPGWHYQWECGKQAMRKWFVNETDGIRFFYQQLLTGDSTDNILGLFGVGAKAASVKALENMDDEDKMFIHVRKQYKDRFGSHWWMFMLENAKLLWILREPIGDAHGAAEAQVYDRLMRYRDYEETTEEGNDDGEESNQEATV